MRSLLLTILGSLTISGTSSSRIIDLDVTPHLKCAQVRTVGALPQTVYVGAVKVQFYEWMSKDLGSDVYVGFKAQATGEVTFHVQAGHEWFRTSSPQWINPHGVVGRNVKGIDRVEVCVSGG